MNTFSYEAKHEILTGRYDASCCATAALAAVFQTLGEVVFRKGQMTLSLTIDHDDMFQFIRDTLTKFYGGIPESTEIHVSKRVGNDRREMVFPAEFGTRLLEDTGMVTIEEGTRTIHRHIEKMLLMEDCCKIAYLSHSFAGSGTVTVPGEESGGYHMEWTCPSLEMADDIAQLLAHLDVLPKTVQRKDKAVVYLKDKDTISSLLARFGAVKSMLRLEEASAERDMRNRINRGANCMTANLSKTVDASAKQLSAIEMIEQTTGLDQLSPALKEMAQVRRKNPALSYVALAQMMNISKSAVRARLDALVALSDTLKE